VRGRSAGAFWYTGRDPDRYFPLTHELHLVESIGNRLDGDLLPIAQRTCERRGFFGQLNAGNPDFCLRHGELIVSKTTVCFVVIKY
jgi:hypothetical protein